MLISEAELRAALEPLLDRLLAERLRYFQLQLEPRLQSLIEAALEPASAAETAGEWKALATAADPEGCFAALFDLLARPLGGRRALLVLCDGQYAVWRQQGTNLPERFPAPSRELLLRGGTARELRVRGCEVGLIYWPGGGLEEAAAARVELLARTAELALLGWALPAKTSEPAAAVQESAAPRARAAVAVAEGAEARFAQLLIEDLALYLERECPLELAGAVAQGTWRERFGPEIERCRHAFRGRYPGADPKILEEALPRLAAV